MTSDEFITALPAPPARPDDSHKGTFGTVVVVGGSPTMIGAPALCATAALRTGCGLCKVVTGLAVLPYVLTIEPGATGLTEEDIAKLDKRGTVLAVGPGMGVNEEARKVVADVISRERPVVLDADGLTNLAALIADRRSPPRPGCPLVLTPHPGEFARLAGPLGITHDPTDPAARPRAARELATRLRAVVVLKGHRTIVADARRTYVNTTGNPAMATAGSGDVLTGAIASLVAQGMSLFNAAVLGVYLHGLAGDLWSAQHGRAGLAARDLANLLPDAIEKHRRSSIG